MQQEFSQEVIGSTVILKTIKHNPQYLQQISEKQDLDISQISFYQSSLDQYESSVGKQMSPNELNQYQEIETQLNEMDLNQIKKYFKEFVMRLQDQEQLIKRQELQLQTYQQSIWCHNSINEKYEKIKISQQELENSLIQIKNLNDKLQQCQRDIVSLNQQLQEKDFALIEKQNQLNKLNEQYRIVLQTNYLFLEKVETQDKQIEGLQIKSQNEQLQMGDLEQKLKQCNQLIQQQLNIQCRLVQQHENNQKKKDQSHNIQIISYILQYIRRNQRNYKLIIQAKKNVEESNLIIEQLKFIIQKQKEQIKLNQKESSLKDEQLEQQKLKTKQIQNKIISQAEQIASQSELIDKLNYEIQQYQNCIQKFEDQTKGDIALIFKNHLNYFYLSILQIKSIDKFLTHQFIHDMHQYASEFNIKLHDSKSQFKFQIYILGK